MDNENEPFQLQPPDSPFQVAVILKEVFSKLEFRDLTRCRQVSKLWDCEASKQLWKVGRIRPISYKWAEYDDDTGELSDEEESVHLVDSYKILDTFKSRIPSSKDSLISVKICSPYDREALHKEYYCSHYRDAGIIIHGFLTDPILCNLLASIELEMFADLDIVLRLLSELPNLREFAVNFDVATFIKTQSVVPKWHKTSPVQKLTLDTFDAQSDDLTAWQMQKFCECVGVLLGGCVDLKELKLEDDRIGTYSNLINVGYLYESLINPEILEALTLEKRIYVINENATPPRNLEPFKLFSKLAHLNLDAWFTFSLMDWISVMENNYLPVYLKSLAFCVFYPTENVYPPQKLIYDHLVEAGLDRLQSLTQLKINLCRGTNEALIKAKWVEEWEFVEENLALVRAKITFDRQSPIDLKRHKHLRYLTLAGGHDGLTDALKVTPPTVKQLDISLRPGPERLTDDDFRRDGALKSISGLERFRINQSCRKCTVDILKHVFAEMKNLRFVQLPRLHFDERILQEYGVNDITFTTENTFY